jgi:hypothetical protein
MQIVREAKRPVTIKDLASEVVRRHYPSTSRSLPKMVEARVSEVVKKGLLRRVPDQAGVQRWPQREFSSLVAASCSDAGRRQLLGAALDGRNVQDVIVDSSST